MTQQDLMLVIGVIIAGFAFPSILGAFADRRAPRVGAVVLVIGAGMVALAIYQTPGGVTFADIPEAFIRVVAHFIR